MRVVAGELGGRRLVAPPGPGTRPTADRVREALFGILGSVQGMAVLDVFAGSGALAIEALSRGAHSAVAVERDRAALRAINTNRDALGLGDRLRVVGRDWRAALAAEAAVGNRFDLVLVDPPYELLPAALPMIGAALPTLVAPGGVVVLEHARGAMREQGGVPGIAVERETMRRYGGTEITIIWTSREGS